MKAKDMKSAEKVTVLRSILDSRMDDTEKAYICQSFLLNWTDSERVEELVNAARRTNNAAEFVQSDFEDYCETDIPEYVDLDETIGYFDIMREEGRDIPSDLTPELYRRIWNDLVDEYRSEEA